MVGTDCYAVRSLGVGENPELARWRVELLREAARCGAPFAAAPLATGVSHDGGPWEAAPWLPGTPLSLTPDDTIAVEAAVDGLAQFHRVTRQLGQPSQSQTASPIDNRLRRLASIRGEPLGRNDQTAVARWPDLRPIADQLAAAADKATALLHACVEATDAQPVHGDARPEHFLLQDGVLTGLIDFGAMRVDSVLADVARLAGELAAGDADRRDHLAELYEVTSGTPAPRQTIAALDAAAAVISAANWRRWLGEPDPPSRDPAMLATRSLHCLALMATTLAACVASAQYSPTIDIGALGQPADDGFDFPDPESAAESAVSASPGSDLVALSARYAVADGEAPAMIEVTARIARNHYVYSTTQAAGGPLPTSIKVDPASGVRVIGPWQADVAPTVDYWPDAYGDLPLEEHHGTVRWRAPIEVAPGAVPASASVAGTVDTSVCGGVGDAKSCVPLDGLAFEATLVAPGSIPPPSAAPIAPAAEPLEVSELLPLLGLALIGGLILNLMPCVLPVIGLKVLSFAEQAGHDRGKVLALNLAYVAGLMSVFLLLAGLASLAGLGLASESLGWGELYTITEFKVGVTALVFAMALSFLGVWEIPIPGFAGAGKANDLQAEEGFSGAFFKGVFTTVLATPCSGPFLFPVFSATLTTPPAITFLIFAFVGLGMASPYLLIGLFPSLITWLPKPGPWMETFKQLMGFVLLGTVVYLITTITYESRTAVLITLVAIGFACWWIGRTPLTAPASTRTTAWVGGTATAVATGLLAFTLLGPSDHTLPWSPYSQSALKVAKAEGKTVLVDFTADWCLTCKLNLKRAINTERVQSVVEANDVATLLADWTDKNAEIKQALIALGSRSIPLLAIYPADRPDEPILLPDVISEDDLLAALAEAGAVQGNAADVDTPLIEIGDATTGAYR
ncbi:unnamed protein product [Cladocopium goreaui]|uniref:Thiol:disulfide interchange protein DsbD (Protein-disulfide reductase) (Disulfide reductase) n=1 Tax=Cladocopium goreaui TaxID=2562237 RepID=A0A9P1CWU0_9DINO|nr:unnamed protein product [Cladocopium goreaui]